MSKVNIAIVRLTNTAGTGMSAQVPDCIPIGTSEEIGSTASNQATTIAVDTDANGSSEPRSLFWRIANMGTDDIDVSFGSAPDATSDTNKLGIPAGTVALLGCNADGDKVAVTNA